MGVVCLNCDGWGCASCKLEREAARGGEQGPTALELRVESLERLTAEQLLELQKLVVERDELAKRLASPGCGEACPVAVRLRAEVERLKVAGAAVLELSRDTVGWCECDEGDMCRNRSRAAAELDAAMNGRAPEFQPQPHAGWPVARDANGSEVEP